MDVLELGSFLLLIRFHIIGKILGVDEFDLDEDMNYPHYG